MVERNRPAHLDGKDPPVGREQEIWSELVECGKRRLSLTRVVIGGNPFRDEEVSGIDAFIADAAQINPEVFNPSTQEHLHLTGQYARILAVKLSEQGMVIDPRKAEALGEVHDLGRMFTHRKGRNEMVGVALMKRIGFSPDFTRDLCPDTIFAPNGVEKMIPPEAAGKIKSSVRATTSNPYWAVVFVADLLAKRVGGRLRRWEDVISQGHFSKNYQKPDEMWPSETRRWTGGEMAGHTRAVNYLYQHTGRWLEAKMGVSINSVVDQLETSLTQSVK